mgnify:CR=1 FL=1
MVADTGRKPAIFGSVLTVAAAGLGAATAYALSLAAIQAASFSPAYEWLAGWLPRGSVDGE